MGIRVNYTQRGFQSKEEYEGFTGRTDTEPYNPDRLVKTIVRCKSCGIADTENYTIQHVESRDLIANPIICGNCSDKNVQIEYFKPDVLPKVFVDENHKNTSMYDNILNAWDRGEIHASFEYIIDALRHPDNYYGSQGKASYVEPDAAMMNGRIKDEDGNPITWGDYPWVDIKLITDPPLNTEDPKIVVEPLASIPPVPDQQFLDTKEYLNNNGDPTGKWLLKDVADYYAPMGAIKWSGKIGTGTTQYYKCYFEPGLWFDWDRDINETELTAIDRWEEDTGSVHPRRGRQIPEVNTYIYGDEDSGVLASVANAHYDAGQVVLNVGDIFYGEDAVDLTLYNENDDCDYINDDPDVFLPGVSPILKDGKDIIFPPIPLYVNGTTGEGSPIETDPITNEWISGYDYTPSQIAGFKSSYPWLEITNVSKREGSKYAEQKIIGYRHQLRNRLIPIGDDCNPGLSFNNDIYTCKMFITRQVDLDAPIYT